MIGVQGRPAVGATYAQVSWVISPFSQRSSLRHPSEPPTPLSTHLPICRPAELPNSPTL